MGELRRLVQNLYVFEIAYLTSIDWIPGYLHPDTQAALRAEMEKPQSSSDVPGYIYTFEIRGMRP